MTRTTAFSAVVLLFALHLCNEARFAAAYPEKPPFEEAKENFRHQNVRAAINITGRVYVTMRNYNISTQFRCLYSKRVKVYNRTQYILTLGAAAPPGWKYIRKFNTPALISKTGRHKRYNAVTYKFRQTDPPKLHKLMYINRERSCLIFVENRKSARENARCQLMQPAAFAGGRIPVKCLTIFRDNCPGSTVIIYKPWCEQLRELPPK
uniref:Putative licpodalin-4 1 n=1 Tax=Amblyomma parvum TaxID=251391 RepID=A0A023G168_AMBPA